MQSYKVLLTLRSYLWLMTLAGILGGFVVGVLYAAVALIKGDFGEAFGTVLFSPVAHGVISFVIALAGYPLYKRAMAHGTASELSGTFERIVEDGVHESDRET